MAAYSSSVVAFCGTQLADVAAGVLVLDHQRGSRGLRSQMQAALAGLGRALGLAGELDRGRSPVSEGALECGRLPRQIPVRGRLSRCRTPARRPRLYGSWPALGAWGFLAHLLHLDGAGADGFAWGAFAVEATGEAVAVVREEEEDAALAAHAPDGLRPSFPAAGRRVSCARIQPTSPLVWRG
jgi:hypothetical protein